MIFHGPLCDRKGLGDLAVFQTITYKAQYLDFFCSQIGAASDEIPVVVKVGMQEIGHFRSLYKIPAQAMPGVLEAKITYVTMGREEIIIQVKLKDYNTKL